MLNMKSIFGIINCTHRHVIPCNLHDNTIFLSNFNLNIVDENHRIFSLKDDVNITSKINPQPFIFLFNINKYLSVEVNKLDNLVTLKSDPYGRGSFYYMQNENEVVYSDRIEWILAYRNNRMEIDMHALVESIFLNIISPPKTLYKNISTLDKNKEMKIHYCDPNNITINFEPLKNVYLLKENFFFSYNIVENSSTFSESHDEIFNNLPVVSWLCQNSNISFEESFFYHAIKNLNFDKTFILKLTYELFNFHVFLPQNMRLSTVKMFFLKKMTKKYFKLHMFDDYIMAQYDNLKLQYVNFVNTHELNIAQGDILFDFLFHYPVRVKNICNLIKLMNLSALQPVLEEIPRLFNFNLSKIMQRDHYPATFYINKGLMYDSIQRVFYNEDNILNALFMLNPFSFNQFIRTANKFSGIETTQFLKTLLTASYLVSTQ